ncbi:MAG: UDP-N-acetylmuramoyl-L-alanine--D-glutamate ligase [Bacteroidales bacterium]|nr:UDP-N-acetylmuramoyl-L-alanine--D-glutamate ligase [Bacteroidales bacterium]
MMKKDIILNHLKEKKIVILGFGREGVASYKFIRNYFPTMPLTIADKSPLIHVEDCNADQNLTIVAGPDYDQKLNQYDMILKSPGVNLNTINYYIPLEKFSSQTDLFLEAFGDNTIGVTGTKGKSTTASLIYHILSNTVGNTVLAGNIGIPFFDMIERMEDDTTVVAELSAHQLEYTHHSPHVAILLNLYQEHLDHFNTFNNYQIAKLNITAYQSENDILIYNYDDRYIPKLLESNKFNRRFIPFSTQFPLTDGAFCLKKEINLVKNGDIYASIAIGSRNNIRGIHNNNNIMAAILACKTQNIDNEAIANNIATFQGLPHRLEWVGEYEEINFYNDSISTIPEAAIAALKTLNDVATLIVGGFDRGIDYQLLIDFLHENPVQNVVFVGKVGERILAEWQAAGFPLPASYLVENDYAKIVDFAYAQTPAGKSCLLSPAAASYDQFKDFIERGNTYKKLIANHTHQL